MVAQAVSFGQRFVVVVRLWWSACALRPPRTYNNLHVLVAPTTFAQVVASPKVACAASWFVGVAPDNVSALGASWFGSAPEEQTGFCSPLCARFVCCAR